MKPIVGRKKDLATFQELYNSNQSDFVAVYGRRRVGKTFLIRSAFEGKISFQVTGLSKAKNKSKNRIPHYQIVLMHPHTTLFSTLQSF